MLNTFSPPPPPPPISQQAMMDLLCTIMVLCRGFDARREPIWAYLCIKPSMAKAFKDARARGNIDISEFGSVIESGAGAEPPEDVKRRMERDFGMNHAFEENLLAAAAKMQDKRDAL